MIHLLNNEPFKSTRVYKNLKIRNFVLINWFKQTNEKVNVMRDLELLGALVKLTTAFPFVSSISNEIMGFVVL